MKDLSLLEKIPINIRAKKDVRKQAVKRVCFPDLEEGRRMVIEEKNANSLNSTLFSPFIGDELSTYENVRDHNLGKKRCWFWVYNQMHGKTRRPYRFPKGISEIDNQITLYARTLDLTADKNYDKLEELNRRRTQYEQSQEFHMVQMCINHAAKLRSDYALETDSLYLGITALLRQKITLLESMSELNKVNRARRYRRVRYYCGRVCTLNPALGPEYMKDDVLARLACMSTLGEYERVLEDARKQLDRYEKEYNTINSWK